MTVMDSPCGPCSNKDCTRYRLLEENQMATIRGHPSFIFFKSVIQPNLEYCLNVFFFLEHSSAPKTVPDGFTAPLQRSSYLWGKRQCGHEPLDADLQATKFGRLLAAEAFRFAYRCMSPAESIQQCLRPIFFPIRQLYMDYLSTDFNNCMGALLKDKDWSKHTWKQTCNFVE